MSDFTEHLLLRAFDWFLANAPCDVIKFALNQVRDLYAGLPVPHLKIST
jgi:hypothetical protein